jgi:hypothetical protein
VKRALVLFFLAGCAMAPREPMPAQHVGNDTPEALTRMQGAQKQLLSELQDAQAVQRPNCESKCTLVTDICELSQRICELSQRLPNDTADDPVQTCREAQTRCAQARTLAQDCACK